MPIGLASHLTDKPIALENTSTNPERPKRCDELKHEMDGQITRGAWSVVEQPKGGNVLDTETF